MPVTHQQTSRAFSSGSEDCQTFLVHGHRSTLTGLFAKFLNDRDGKKETAPNLE